MPITRTVMPILFSQFWPTFSSNSVARRRASSGDAAGACALTDDARGVERVAESGGAGLGNGGTGGFVGSCGGAVCAGVVGDGGMTTDAGGLIALGGSGAIGGIETGGGTGTGAMGAGFAGAGAGAGVSAAELVPRASGTAGG